MITRTTQRDVTRNLNRRLTGDQDKVVVGVVLIRSVSRPLWVVVSGSRLPTLTGAQLNPCSRASDGVCSQDKR